MKVEKLSDYVQAGHWLLDKTDFLLAGKVIGDTLMKPLRLHIFVIERPQ